MLEVYGNPGNAQMVFFGIKAAKNAVQKKEQDVFKHKLYGNGTLWTLDYDGYHFDDQKQLFCKNDVKSRVLKK